MTTDPKVWEGRFTSGSLADCGLPKHVLYERQFSVSLESAEEAVISCAGLEIKVNEDGLDTLLGAYDEETLTDWAKVALCERYKNFVAAYGNLPMFSTSQTGNVTISINRVLVNSALLRQVNRANMEKMHAILMPEVTEVETADKSADQLVTTAVNRYVCGMPTVDLRGKQQGVLLTKADLERANLTELLGEQYLKGRALWIADFPVYRQGSEKMGDYRLIWEMETPAITFLKASSAASANEPVRA